MNWQIVEETDHNGHALEYQRVTTGLYHLDVTDLQDGNWLFQVESDHIDLDFCGIWIEEVYDSEVEAKQAALAWLLEQINELLKAAAAGTWLIRGADDEIKRVIRDINESAAELNREEPYGDAGYEANEAYKSGYWDCAEYAIGLLRRLVEDANSRAPGPGSV